jgi:hypothetical protein
MAKKAAFFAFEKLLTLYNGTGKVEADLRFVPIFNHELSNQVIRL